MDAVALDQLQNPQSAYYSTIQRPTSAVSGSTGSIRLDAVRDAALGVGLRGGLKSRTDELLKALDAVSKQMDGIYNFVPYVIQGRVLPPVIVEARDIYTQAGDTALRLAGRSYRIESQARFVSRPPAWQDYLILRYEVNMPAPALLPKDDKETALWSSTVAEGWRQGREQAERVFQKNFDRLERDFLGVVRFHKLVEANMLTMPIIARTSMPISGDANKVHLDEELLRITVLPRFNLDLVEWKATPGRIEPKGPQPVPRANSTNQKQRAKPTKPAEASPSGNAK
jgi:defect-in-organelle-trafficking protein DotC